MPATPELLQDLSIARKRVHDAAKDVAHNTERHWDPVGTVPLTYIDELKQALFELQQIEIRVAAQRNTRTRR